MVDERYLSGFGVVSNIMEILDLLRLCLEKLADRGQLSPEYFVVSRFKAFEKVFIYFN